MSLITANQIAARLSALEAKLDAVDELRELVDALLEGRSAGMRAAFENYGGVLDELRDQLAAQGKLALALDIRLTSLDARLEKVPLIVRDIIDDQPTEKPKPAKRKRR